MRKRLNGEGTLYQDKKNNRWQYRLTMGYDAQEKPIRKAFYGKTPDEAKAKGDKALEELNGRTVNVSPSMTLDSWLTMYLENYKKGTVQNRWYEQMQTMKNSIPAALRNKKVSAITPIELQKLLNDLLLTKSKSYVDKMKIIIKAAFAEAQENGLCTQNPARKLTVPAKPEKPREAYTVQEATTIIQAAKTHHNKVMAAATVVMLLTGIRRGELLGLKWSDMEENILHIKRGVYMEKNQPIAEEYRAKTKGSIRSIPLMPEAIEAINSLPNNGEYIFITNKGNIMKPYNFNKGYYNFIKTIPDLRQLPPHCLRHTYASLTLATGANLRNVQILLGHKDPKTTAIYTHPDMAALHESVLNMTSAIMAKNDANIEAN